MTMSVSRIVAIMVAIAIANILHVSAVIHLDIEKFEEPYTPWSASVSDKAAIFYDPNLPHFEIMNAIKKALSSKEREHPHLFYTGVGMELMEVNEKGFTYDCYYYHKEEQNYPKEIFAKVHYDYVKKEWFVKILGDHRFFFTPSFFEVYVYPLFKGYTLAASKTVALALENDRAKNRVLAVLVIPADKETRTNMNWKFVEVPQQMPVVPSNPMGKQWKFGYVYFKAVNQVPIDDSQVNDAQDYGQKVGIVSKPNENGQNAVAIFDKHGFQILVRKSSEWNEWQMNPTLGFSENSDFFKHIDGLMWMRMNDRLAVQEKTEIRLNEGGKFIGIERGKKLKILEHPGALKRYKTHSAVKSGAYKSHQGGLGDCVMHAINAVCGGPFWTNAEFGKICLEVGTATNQDSYEHKERQKGHACYRKWKYRHGLTRKLALGYETFSNKVVLAAIETIGVTQTSVGGLVGHETFRKLPNDKMLGGPQTVLVKGAPKFLGLTISYYANPLRKDKDPHRVAFVYKPVGKGYQGAEGYWFVQSWDNFGRIWFTVDGLNIWLAQTRDGKKKFGDWIYRWLQLHAYYISDEKVYHDALKNVEDNPLFQKQFGNTPKLMGKQWVNRNFAAYKSEVGISNSQSQTIQKSATALAHSLQDDNVLIKDGHVHSKPSLVGDDSPHSHRHYHEMNRLDYAHSHADDGYGDEKVPMDVNSGVEYWQVLELFVGGTMMIVLTLVFCFGLVFCAAGLAMHWFYTHLEVKRTEKKMTIYQQANEEECHL
eukprot:874977_1